MSPGKRRIVPRLLSLNVLMIVGVLYVLQPRFLTFMDKKSVDLLITGQSNPPQANVPVFIAAVDSKSIDAFGRWPWTRSRMATLIQELTDYYQVKTIGLDMVFSEPETVLPEQNRNVNGMLEKYSAKDQALLRNFLQTLSMNSADIQLAQSIQQGNVTLGYFFFLSSQRYQVDQATLKTLKKRGVPESLLQAMAPLQLYRRMTLEEFDQLLNQKLTEEDLAQFQSMILEESTHAPWDYLTPEQQRQAQLTLQGNSFNLVSGVRHLNSVPLMRGDAVEPNISRIHTAGKEIGFLNAFPDGEDGVIRRAHLVMRYGELLYPSLPLQLLKTFRDEPSMQVMLRENRMIELRMGSHVFPTDADGAILLNFRGPRGTFATFSVVDIMEHRVPKEFLTDKIALVGITEAGLLDIYNTPVGNMFPGVEIHATVLENLMHQAYLKISPWQDVILLSAILGVGVLLSWLSHALIYPWFSVVSSLLLLSAFATHYYVVIHLQTWMSILYPFLLIFGIWVVNTVYRLILIDLARKQARQRIIETKNVFQLFVPPQFLDRISKGRFEALQHGIARQSPVSVMFSDIRSFTTISENLSHLELFQLLNEYMRHMIPEIQRQGGFIDKFIGDAIMALFDEESCKNAYGAESSILAAIEMVKALDLFNEKRKAAFQPPILSGIGINSGTVTMGTLGNESRMESTVIGDAVNLASRLEGLTKTFGSRILISESTWKQLPDPDRFQIREVGYVSVKGKKKPTTLYEVFDADPEWVRNKKAKSWPWLLKGMGFYHHRRFDDAVEALKTATAIFSEDVVIQQYLHLALEYQKNPPGENWDSQIVMTHK
ncbi:MAG: adenylate/guanylate cyclase domain-containing protein [SAR324 cluster bacterium]|nr:adenylate/guanylate cyclase domain-containing protein [SAR324 cluster bacterium]